MSDAPTRPLPEPTWLTEPFWGHTRRHVLVRPYCARCDRSFFTPQVVCPGCWQEDWTWQPSTGRGRVYSYSIVHRAPEPGFVTPYVLAVIDLEEGWAMLSNLRLDDIETARIDLPVRVTWLDEGTVSLPLFEPDPDREGAPA